MEVDFILFDLYGTLVEVEVNEDTPAFWAALANNLRDRGVCTDPTQLREAFFSIFESVRSRLPDGFIMESVLMRLLLALGGKATNREVQSFGAAFRKFSIKRLSLRSYTGALLEAVRASGCKTGIVSNTEGILTRFDLSRFPSLQRVDVTILSSEVGMKKPARGIFRVAMKRLGVTPKTGVFVGDNLQDDIIGAQRVGLRCIYLRNDGDDLNGGSNKPRVREAIPNLESIGKALRELGWTGTV